nr:MAG TPA: hypothetical protein [Caudoviricetes sp.]
MTFPHLLIYLLYFKGSKKSRYFFEPLKFFL